MPDRYHSPNEQSANAAGVPYAGGLLYFYTTGTSTPANTYSDSTLLVPNANPVVLDSAGRAGNIFLDPAVTYKVVHKDASGNSIWSADPVTSGAAVAATFTVYAGNPNGNVAGNAGTVGGTGASVIYDITNKLIYVCTTTGTSSTAVWTSPSLSLTGKEDLHTVSYTVVTADNCRTQVGNSATAITFTLTAAATLGAGFILPLKNINVGVLTIDANSTETIDGHLTIALQQYEAAILYCNGSTWRILALWKTIFTENIQTNDYTVTINDNGNLQVANKASAITYTLTAVATLGSGFWIPLKNIGAGQLTIKANSSETIDGATALVLNQNDSAIIGCNGSLWRILSLTRVPSANTGFLFGLTLSNDGGTPNTKFDVAAGACRDSTDVDTLVLAGAFVKTSSSWVVGSGNGGLDTGAFAASSIYYPYLIKRVDTGVVDALFSLSATAPTMPTSYTLKRRIGGLLTDGSVHFLPFTQFGDWFYLTTSIRDINDATLTTARKLYTLSAPPSTLVLGRLMMSNAGITNVVVQPTAETDAAPSGSAVPGSTLIDVVANTPIAGQLQIMSDASGQIAARSLAASTTIIMLTLGWMDQRGRQY